MPLGLSITTKANLLAGKYTFSYFLSDPVSQFSFWCGCFLWFMCLTGSLKEAVARHRPPKAEVLWIIFGGLIDFSQCVLHPSINFGAAAGPAGTTCRVERTCRAEKTGRAETTGRG